MLLHYKSIGEGFPLIICHGLFGSLDNWQTLAKKYASHFRVITLDLRNHGKSPHSDQCDYNIMAEDIKELLHHLNIRKAHFLGHSMGGKVVMQFAFMYPDMVQKLIVVDISTSEYPPLHTEIFQVLLNANLQEANSRGEVEEQLMPSISSFSVRQFLLKGLTRNAEKKFVWKYNVAGLWKNYTNILDKVTPASVVECPTLFIRGSSSLYIQESDIPIIEKQFSNYDLKTIEEAGHWVHAEKPVEFLMHTQAFLLS